MDNSIDRWTTDGYPGVEGGHLGRDAILDKLSRKIWGEALFLDASLCPIPVPRVVLSSPQISLAKLSKMASL